MIPDTIAFSLQGGLDFPMPKMVKVRQKFDDAHIADIKEATMAEIGSLPLPELSGKRVALTAGSRQIQNLVEILRTTAAFLKQRGAIPFIVPAMGSHGGATADGQERLLREYGITEQSIGVPVRSNMDVVKIGSIAGGYPIYCDKTAYEADFIVPIGRIKPHTSISGKVESGLCKMMVVGLGKHVGATSFHRQGYEMLASILPQGAKVFLDSGKILFGLGIVENAFDQTQALKAVLPQHLIDEEAELLLLAKKNMPRFLLEEIDVLVIERIGKDISGAGMDPNVTGRAVTPLPVKTEVNIRSIAVLDITEASHGNATGIGGADITTKRVVEKIDFESMYTNVFTSGALIAARLPVIVNTDEQAIRVCIRCAPKRLEDVKVVRIRDTLHMADIEVSENYLPSLVGDKRFAILCAGEPMEFDGNGRLR